jgi:putative solute:sodium symporter small subunit
VNDKERYSAYWRANLRLVGVLLSVWFLVSYGCGILFVDALDSIRIAGFGLGFWFAQQGSILVFVALIVVYVRQMRRLDARFGVAEAEEPGRKPEKSEVES